MHHPALVTMSVPFALWFGIIAIALLMRTWQMRPQYQSWRLLPPREFRGLIFMPMMAGLALYCCIQRSRAIWNLMTGFWTPVMVDGLSVWFLMPLGVIVANGLLWCCCSIAFNGHGLTVYRKVTFLGVALALGFLAATVRG